MRAALRQMVKDRETAKKVFGKGSLEDKTIKAATNSGYGKLAQDVSERSGWDAWSEEMASIGGSAVTSPYHAAMTTSLVRALLLAMANEVEMISVTTDGFIATECLCFLKQYLVIDSGFCYKRQGLINALVKPSFTNLLHNAVCLFFAVNKALA